MESNGKKAKKIAVVSCQGGKRAAYKVKSSELKGDCRQVLEEYPEGILECASGCVGQGSCVSVCRLDAIHINDNHTVQVDAARCVGCGLCVKACPQNLIHLTDPENTIVAQCTNSEQGALARNQCEVSCIGCGICEKNCPAGAASVTGNCVVIDYERCIACGMCAVKCPRHVIVDMDGIFTVQL